MSLNEQIREIHFLNEIAKISNIMDRERFSLVEMLQKIVEIIPTAWPFPSPICARIILENDIIQTANFTEMAWRLERNIFVDGTKFGLFEVHYLEKKLIAYEESLFINMITERLGKIIQRRKTIEALRNSERGFRSLVENSPIGISIVKDNQLIYRNPENEKIIGPLPMLFSEQGAVNIHPADSDKVRSFYQKLVTGEDNKREIEFRFFSSGIEEPENMKWLLCKASLIEYQGDDAILINLLDVTGIKKLERLLGIEDKMASLGRVAAGIAHEIRNPLSGINIYLSALEKMIENVEDRDKIRKILPQMKTASDRIEAVIKRVMDFAKPSEPNLIPADINISIEDAVKLSEVTLRKSGIKLIYKLARDMPKCRLDSQLITQVILNLINNAADAMKANKRDKEIEVTSHVKHDRIEIRVSDSGPGVPLNQRNKIFEPYYTTKEGGTGIGLSISQRIINDHGGSLKVGENKKGGAVFIFDIPADQIS